MPGDTATIEFEQSNAPVVISPWEAEKHWAALAAEAGSAAGPVAAIVIPFLRDWRALWARFEAAPEGWPEYQQLVHATNERLQPLRATVALPNGTDLVEMVRQHILRPSLNPTLGSASRRRSPPPAAAAATQPHRPPAVRRLPAARRVDRAVRVAGPLARSVDGRRREPRRHRGRARAASGQPRLGLQPADRDRRRAHVAAALRVAFEAQLRDRDGNPPPDDGAPLRMLEKTPKNALRVPFLNAVFPDALFVYLYRDPRPSIASMIEAWETQRFVTYPQLPEWEGEPWSLLLPPGWRDLRGASLAEIAAAQWDTTTRPLLADLEKLPPQRWCVVDYDAFVADPRADVERVCDFAGVSYDDVTAEPLPLSRHTVSEPAPDKWRAREDEMRDAVGRTDESAAAARDLIARPRPARRDPGPPPERLRSSSSTAAPRGARSDRRVARGVDLPDGPGRDRAPRGRRGQHPFPAFDGPMGIAYDDGRLAIGTRTQIQEFRDVPTIAAALGAGHDACFVPRRAHHTGDVRVHDLAYAGDELWFVATRFSCLATLDDAHSFVPRWTPPFISGLAAEDRCHLNGLCVVDDEVRYVTALGESDAPGGWRENRARGGVVIDVDSGATIASGLSMPHSPRWHDGRLWVLESGEGGLGILDPETGAYETIARLPGFTRGLSFHGDLAFVGLSEVREGVTFGGLPLTARLEERECGVWVVDVTSGETVAYLRFEDLVEELFEVALLPGLRFPEIAEPDSPAVASAFVVPPVSSPLP